MRQRDLRCEGTPGPDQPPDSRAPPGYAGRCGLCAGSQSAARPSRAGWAGRVRVSPSSGSSSICPATLRATDDKRDHITNSHTLAEGTRLTKRRTPAYQALLDKTLFAMHVVPAHT